MHTDIEEAILKRVDERVRELLSDADTVMPAWLNSKKAAEYTNISKKQLELMRYQGRGPEFVRRGRMVLYPLVGLDIWLREGAK